MRWRNARTDPPTLKGFYFCMHPCWGKCVFGFNEGWGPHEPTWWLDESEESNGTANPVAR